MRHYKIKKVVGAVIVSWCLITALFGLMSSFSFNRRLIENPWTAILYVGSLFAAAAAMVVDGAIDMADQQTTSVGHQLARFFKKSFLYILLPAAAITAVVVVLALHFRPR